MIINAILLLFQGVLNVILAPITIINIGVDFLGSIPVITSFLECVTYLLPWTNLLPIIGIVVAIFSLRIVIGFVLFIKQVVFNWI